MKILVLGGGDGAEREVSQRSAKAVQTALEELRHSVGYFDPKGRWAQLGRVAKDYELVFPVIHGTGGEDGQVQRVLDAAGVRYVGSGVAASELCIDKPRVKQLMRRHDLPTPAGEVVTAASFAKSPLIQRPFVLKPTSDGSSVGMLIARTAAYDKAAVRQLFERYDEMLLEQLVTGVELTVPVLGDKALPAVEIIPPENGEFDYENKYNGATSEISPPRSLDADTHAAAQRLAERLHALVGARHLSRTDMMLDASNQLYVLEINTMPGMTSQSLYPKGAAAAGLNWKQLVARLIELATSG